MATNSRFYNFRSHLKRVRVITKYEVEECCQMADIKTAQIVSQEEGPEKRSVLLTLRDDGSIQMYTSDDSQLAQKIWGKEDYEFWVTVPPDAVPKFMSSMQSPGQRRMVMADIYESTPKRIQRSIRNF